MAWTLLLGFVAMTLVFVWMVAVRYRIEVLARPPGRRGARGLIGRAAGRGRRGSRDPARGEPAGLSVPEPTGGPGELRRRRLRRSPSSSCRPTRVGLVLRRRRLERRPRRLADARPRGPGTAGDGDRPGRPPTGAAGRRGPGCRAPAGARPARPGAAGSATAWSVAVLVGAAVVFLLVEGLGSSLDYFDTVDQAAGPPGQPRHLDHPPRGRGRARDRSRAPPTGADFAVAGGPARVGGRRTSGSPPQLFQPNIPVVVVGHFAVGRVRRLRVEPDHGEALGQLHRPAPGRVKAPNGSVR